MVREHLHTTTLRLKTEKETHGKTQKHSAIQRQKNNYMQCHTKTHRNTKRHKDMQCYVKTQKNTEAQGHAVTNKDTQACTEAKRYTDTYIQHTQRRIGTHRARHTGIRIHRDTLTHIYSDTMVYP